MLRASRGFAQWFSGGVFLSDTLNYRSIGTAGGIGYYRSLVRFPCNIAHLLHLVAFFSIVPELQEPICMNVYNQHCSNYNQAN